MALSSQPPRVSNHSLDLATDSETEGWETLQRLLSRGMEASRALPVSEFTKLFGDKFLLLSKEEVLKRKLFGTGPEHPCFRAMLGDYLAIATGDLSIFNTPEIAKRFIGIHAGLTEEEMRIPLVVWEGRR